MSCEAIGRSSARCETRSLIISLLPRDDRLSKVSCDALQLINVNSSTVSAAAAIGTACERASWSLSDWRHALEIRCGNRAVLKCLAGKVLRLCCSIFSAALQQLTAASLRHSEVLAATQRVSCDHTATGPWPVEIGKRSAPGLAPAADRGSGLGNASGIAAEALQKAGLGSNRTF